jgi:nitrogen fixation/metabolism regulation signal transduction histidine kinase
VSLKEVMLECQSMIEPQAKQRGIRMSFPRFDRPCFVQADRTRVKQVLINLLSNAIKYNQAGRHGESWSGPQVPRTPAQHQGHRRRIERPRSSRNCSSPSIGSGRRPVPRKAPASAWW